MIIQLLNDGGLFFMLPILFLFITIVVLFIKELLSKRSIPKTISLISSISLFVIVWGVLGQCLGLISAFDTIEGDGAVTIPILACGLKISFLPTVFGLFTFLVGRLGVIVLTLLESKKDDVND